jgi:hypothetical protein
MYLFNMFLTHIHHHSQKEVKMYLFLMHDMFLTHMYQSTVNDISQYNISKYISIQNNC